MSPVTVFDIVSSQGVIHHTHNTKKAFDSVVPFVRDGGAIFVWVYAKEDAQMLPGFQGKVRRFVMIFTQGMIRPVLARLPSALRSLAIKSAAILLHPMIKGRRERHRDQWSYANTVHVLRDGFTPRYIHYHGFNEILAWFEDSGFVPQVQSSATYKKMFQRDIRGVGILGRYPENGNGQKSG